VWGNNREGDMKKTAKYYVAKGIIGMGQTGIDYGIRCELIHHAFNPAGFKCVSGDSRLRHELKNEFNTQMLIELNEGKRKKIPEPYEYINKRKWYRIHKTFLIWLRKVYGRVE